jgi:exo-1,4-beta-D-glucosaminidase
MNVYLPTEVHERASRAPVRSWQVLSSASTTGNSLGGGEEISSPGYCARGWYVAPPRSTVMAVLLANGLYPGIERSRAMEEVDEALFEVPWWYRTTFTTRGSGRTTLRIDGVVHKADVWVNGRQVATADQTAGAYSVTSFDVTDVVTNGLNALALEVHPGNPLEDLSISWVDWARWPPDNNMGVWRDVVVERTGDVRLSPPAVTALPSLPALESADVSISVELANLSATPVVAELRGQVTDGQAVVAVLSRDVALPLGARRMVTFSPQDTPALRLDEPRVWWPVGEGPQPLYDLELTAAVEGLISDQRSASFGVRTVTSYVAKGDGMRFVVNGRELQIVGAGWAPDIFLRHDAERMAAELGYALDMGLNALRLEGKLENPEFFAMTDASGLMVLPGWECCSRWEVERREPTTVWSEHEFVVAERQMASEAVLLRNHPSVIGFLIGSDYAPPPRTASLYVGALKANAWSLPVVSSAMVEGTAAAGASGMKMTGPYSYVPPVYWYSKDPKRGGAIGFNSETSAGSTIPRLPSLRRMLSDRELESLWREPEAKQFHAGPPSDFDNLAVFHRALAGRYGAPTSLTDFCRKAQLANYETVRAQFEAYASQGFADNPATGLVYWMFNSAWPSLNWQLYDWYLDAGGAYFGAKKANELVHPIYDYGAGTVEVVNRGHHEAGPFELAVEVRDLTGSVVSAERYEVAEVPARGVVPLAAVLVPPVGGATYFLALHMAGPAGSSTTRNVYWLSTTPDVLDWDQGPWHHTPLAQFADLTGLEHLPSVTIDAGAELGPVASGRCTAHVTLRNASPAGTPAVGLHASVVSAGTPVAPVRWSDNDVTLFAGEQLELRVSYPAVPGAEVAVEVEGFNVDRRAYAWG